MLPATVPRPAGSGPMQDAFLVDVSQLFSQTEILITGANGFVGKVLLALLLDRYPDVKKVHVLLRPRRGVHARERFEKEILDSPPFRDANRNRISDKVQVIEGDVSNEANFEADLSGVGLIIHCAGLVEFFPPVDQSIAANVDAALNVAALAKRLKAKLVHVSTCYVAGRADGLVEEDEPIYGFYPERQGLEDDSFDPETEVQVIRQAELRLEHDREALIELGRERAARWGWVNTYTYSKSLGEQLLAQEADLELSIVRPAIVECASEFPFPGWVEGGRTAAPLVLMAMGGLTDWPAREDISLEVVPVDLVASAILVAGALLLDGKAALVYQLASADRNPFPMGPLLDLLDGEAKRRKRTPGTGARLHSWVGFQERNRQVRESLERSERRLQGYASSGLPGAGWARARAAAARAGALQVGFREQTIEQYLPFILENRYVFEANNMRADHGKLTEADREKLPWAPESIDWPKYWSEKQIPGVERWVQPDVAREWSFQI